MRDAPGPTSQRIQKPDMAAVFNNDGRLVHFRSFEWPLLYYQNAKLLSSPQIRAGNKFNHLWRQGCIKTRFAHIRYDEHVEIMVDIDRLPATWEEYKDAINAVANADRRYMVYQVCCLGQMAGRGNMGTLRDGLDDLRSYFRKDEGGL